MSKRLLIVDDSEFMRMIIKKAIEKESYEIDEASNGREAIEKYKKQKFDLISMDITMPDMNGLEALKELKKIDKDVRVIICSSMVYKDNVDEVKEAGAIDFVLKPFDNEKYAKTIKANI